MTVRDMNRSPVDNLAGTIRGLAGGSAAAMQRRTEAAVLVALLRIGGVLTGSAFLAMVLPVEWMASTHEWLGLGAFPRTAVVDYLARSVAALYGFHGVLLCIISTDLSRYRPMVWYVAGMNLVFGLMLLVIGVHASLPTWWIVVEGPSVMTLGIIVALLNRRIAHEPPMARLSKEHWPR